MQGDPDTAAPGPGQEPQAPPRRHGRAKLPPLASTLVAIPAKPTLNPSFEPQGAGEAGSSSAEREATPAATFPGAVKGAPTLDEQQQGTPDTQTPHMGAAAPAAGDVPTSPASPPSKAYKASLVHDKDPELSLPAPPSAAHAAAQRPLGHGSPGQASQQAPQSPASSASDRPIKAAAPMVMPAVRPVTIAESGYKSFTVKPSERNNSTFDLSHAIRSASHVSFLNKNAIMPEPMDGDKHGMASAESPRASGPKFRFAPDGKVGRRSSMSSKVVKVLQDFDADGDGQLNETEVTNLVNQLITEERSSRIYKVAAVVLVVFALILLAGTFGLTWVVVKTLQETQVEYVSGGGSVLVDKNTRNPIQVASTDTVMHPAGFIAVRGGGSNGTGGEAARIAPSNGIPMRLSSAQPINSFFDLKHIKFENGFGGEVVLRVDGAVRVMDDEAIRGSIVQVLTPAGTITFDDTLVIFDGDSKVFKDAGFVTQEEYYREHGLQSSTTDPEDAELPLNMSLIISHSTKRLLMEQAPISVTGTVDRHDARRLITSSDDEHSKLSGFMNPDGSAKPLTVEMRHWHQASGRAAASRGGFASAGRHRRYLMGTDGVGNVALAFAIGYQYTDQPYGNPPTLQVNDWSSYFSAVMTGTVNVYIVYYGAWTNTAAVENINYFVSNMQSSSWYAMMKSYYQLDKGYRTYVNGQVKLGGTVKVAYPGGQLVSGQSGSNMDVWNIIASQISNRALPDDPVNGIYILLSSREVTPVDGMCTSYCGWHSAQWKQPVTNANGQYTAYKYAYIGSTKPIAFPSCNCQVQPSGTPDSYYPNKDGESDVMLSVIAHEIVETVSDAWPGLGWIDGATGTENADYCAWNFGTSGVSYLDPPYNNYPISNVVVGNRKYLIQLNYDIVSKQCVAGVGSSTPVDTSCTAGYQKDASGNCVACAAGTTSVAAGTCTACPLNTYAPIAGSTVCTQCSAGTQATNTGSTSCTACPVGSYSLQGQGCRVCPAGTTTTATGMGSCTNCPAGQSSTTGTCANCPAGQSSVSGGTCTACPSGTYSVSGGQCISCGAGYIFITQTGVCGPCSPGTSTTKTLSTQPANSCYPCPSNSVAQNYGTGACTACPAGTYAANATTCAACAAGQSSVPGAACTACPAGSFSVSGGTCTACPAGTFSASGSSGCTTCTAGKSSSGSASACTACPAGTTSVAGGTCTACDPGYFAASSGATVCNPCPAGTQAVTSGSTSCTQCPAGSFSLSTQGCTQCPAGSVSAVAGSGTCTACALNTFSATPGMKNCTACPAGTQTTATGSSSCTQCPAGSYSVAGQSCRGCAAGSFSASAGATSCTVCPANTYSAASATSCTLCPAGSQATAGNATTCTLCPAGTYSSTDGTACTSCPQGTYSSQPGSTSCSPCGVNAFRAALGATSCSFCPAGTQATTTGSTTCTPCPVGMFSVSGQACTTCAPGTTSTTIGAAVCTNCTAGRSSTNGTCVPCAAGETSVPGGSCTACPINTFSTTTGSLNCTRCAAGTDAPFTGSTSCSQCPAGSYSVSGQACTLCRTGTFSAVSGTANCTACPLHTFGSSTGLTSCTPCAAGTQATTVGSTTCTPCGVGNYSVAGQACTRCPAGSITTTAGSSACTPCAPNTFAATPGLTACTACAAGTQANAGGAANCTQCPVGTYGLQGQPCTACAVGFVQPRNGSTSCTACAAGTTSSDNRTVCVYCREGQYSSAGSACTDCIAGTGSRAGSSTCTPCAAGYYSLTGGGCTPCAEGFSSNAGSDSCYACADGLTSFEGGPCQKPDTMLPGAKITAGNYITSNDQTYRAFMQGDGNFVIYQGNETIGYNKYVWSTFSTPSGVTIPAGTPFIGSAGTAQLTTTGQLQQVNAVNTTCWSTAAPTWLTTSKGPFFMVMQTDGSLAIFGSQGTLTNSGKYLLVWTSRLGISANGTTYATVINTTALAAARIIG